MTFLLHFYTCLTRHSPSLNCALRRKHRNICGNGTWDSYLYVLCYVRICQEGQPALARTEHTLDARICLCATCCISKGFRLIIQVATGSGLTVYVLRGSSFIVWLPMGFHVPLKVPLGAEHSGTLETLQRGPHPM